MDATDETPVAEIGEGIVFEHRGRWGGIVPIALLNAVLNILTLTLWRFWGKTKVRRYVWSTAFINGEALEYTGTGWELCRSFFFVVFVFILPVYLALLAGQLLLSPEVFLFLFFAIYLPLLFLMVWLLGLAMWVARRYRMSRTTWRGIRFGQAGSATGYAWTAVGYGLLTVVTLGWYAPTAEMRLTRRLWRESFFGDRRFEIRLGDDGLAGPLYPTFALHWISYVAGYLLMFVFLFIVMGAMAGGVEDPEEVNSLAVIAAMYMGFFIYLAVIALSRLPYETALLRRKAEMLRLQGLTFRENVTFGGVARVYVVNWILIIFTLGLAVPVAQMRRFRYIFGHLEADGRLDIAAIRQTANRGPKMGEGLADAFDIGNAI